MFGIIYNCCFLFTIQFAHDVILPMQFDKLLRNSLPVLILNDIIMNYTACPLELYMELKKIYIYLLKTRDVSKVKFVMLSHGPGYIHSYSNFQWLNFGQKHILTPPPSIGTVTPITHSSDTLSDGPSEKYVTASMESMEFLTAVIQSCRASITSLKVFPTIPGSDSDYIVNQLPYCTAWNLPNHPNGFHQKLLISLLIHSQLSWEIYLWKLPLRAWLLLLES
jgi:hypothetical protein